MSTTRHLINRRRRTAPPAEESPATGRRPAPAAVRARTRPRPAARPAEDTGKKTPAPPGRPQRTGVRARNSGSASGPGSGAGAAPARRGGRLVAALGAAAVLLGCFAAFAAVQASGGGDGEAAAENAALVDAALTSEVKGGVREAVEAVFSVDYTDLAENEKAARTYLTGDAVEQHRKMLGDVREDAPEQKLVLTTTVTDSAVELADDDAARVLVFADQRNTRTDTDETSYGAAMVAVDAVKDGDRWRISNIDTFG